eukprot:1112228-Pyramimonas_sp.AAC.1
MNTQHSFGGAGQTQPAPPPLGQPPMPYPPMSIVPPGVPYLVRGPLGVITPRSGGVGAPPPYGTPGWPPLVPPPSLHYGSSTGPLQPGRMYAYQGHPTTSAGTPPPSLSASSVGTNYALYSLVTRTIACLTNAHKHDSEHDCERI